MHHASLFFPRFSSKNPSAASALSALNKFFAFEGSHEMAGDRIVTATARISSTAARIASTRFPCASA